VTPTLRGVGTTSSSQKIQIDRYSAISREGVAIEFIDTSDTFQGWKTVMDKTNAWIKYNAVDFGTKKANTVQVKVHSEKGGILRIRINDANGPVLSQVKIPEHTEWQVIETRLKQFQPGIQNLVIESLSDNNVEIDWISFR
jgi:hypothetical protein